MINSLDLGDQREWSSRTFGPGLRTKGLIQHITKELEEIEREPTDLMEWIDIIILAFDGAWRSGHSPEEIINAYHDKMNINFARDWPDWRTVGEEQAIEHIR